MHGASADTVMAAVGLLGPPLCPVSSDVSCSGREPSVGDLLLARCLKQHCWRGTRLCRMIYDMMGYINVRPKADE